MTQISGTPPLPLPPQMNQAQQAQREARSNAANQSSGAAAASKEEIEKKKKESGRSSLPADMGRPVIQSIKPETEESGKTAETSGTQDNVSIDAEEREILKEMASNIQATSKKVSRGVNKSALRHMKEKGWFKKEHEGAAEDFFTVKIPKILSDQLAKYLNETLGIDEAINSKD